MCPFECINCIYHTVTNSREQRLSWKAKRCKAGQEIPGLNGTEWFITAFTRAQYWSSSTVKLINSINSHFISLRQFLILFFHLRLSLPSGSSLHLFNVNSELISHTSHFYCTPRLFYFLQCCHPNNISSLYNFFEPPITPSVLGPRIPSASSSQIPSIYVFLSRWGAKFYAHTEQLPFSHNIVRFTW
jgi:hypothetical protein